jgi:hypothetical protein
MPTYIAKLLMIALTILLGVTFFMGDKDSVKASMSSLMSKSITQIEDVPSK